MSVKTKIQMNSLHYKKNVHADVLALRKAHVIVENSLEEKESRFVMILKAEHIKTLESDHFFVCIYFLQSMCTNWWIYR